MSASATAIVSAPVSSRSCTAAGPAVSRPRPWRRWGSSEIAACTADCIATLPGSMTRRGAATSRHPAQSDAARTMPSSTPSATSMPGATIPGARPVRRAAATVGRFGRPGAIPLALGRVPETSRSSGWGLRGRKDDGLVRAGPAQAENIDWEAIERSDAFQELVRKRKAFVLPGTIFFLSLVHGLHPAHGLRRGLHGRARLQRPDRRLLPRAHAIPHGPRAGPAVPADVGQRLRPARRRRRSRTTPTITSATRRTTTAPATATAVGSRAADSDTEVTR